MRQRKIEKKKEKRGEEDTRGGQLDAAGSPMPVVSFCIEEGGQPCVEIMGGTWVSDACNVGAGRRCRRQDLATAWPLRLLAKQERGRGKMVFGCVSRGHANAWDWEKKKEKKNGLTASLYIGIMPLMPAISLWVEGRGRSCAEAVGGTCAGDAHDVGASGHRRRDLMVAR